MKFSDLERTMLKKMLANPDFINCVADERKGKSVKGIAADFLFGNFYQKNAAFQYI
jgi:hypothetical protein